MSTITNDPILLNETGLKIVEKLDRQNSLLSLMAEGHRQDVYADIAQVANLVRNGYGPGTFPIGDQIVMPWTDRDNGDVVYQVPLDIVHHGEVELESGEIVPGMFLQWHFCSPFGVQFSNYQAFLNCPDGLAAGTYHVTLGATWGSKDTVNGTSWSFTLTQAVPAGGKLSGFEGMPDNASSAWRVKSWATQYAANPIETVVVTSGSNGTSLGIMKSTTLGDSGLNCMHRVAYGHNRWSSCALRQYLNKSGTSWWASKEDFDIRPNEYTKRGFLDGFGQDLLAAIKPIKVTTALNTVEGYTDSTETTFDRFFLPSMEQMNVTPQLTGVEGPHFPYWRRRLGLHGFASTGSANIYEAYKIPAINAQTTPQTVRLRSASRSSAYSTWYVISSGCVYYNSASSALRFSPVCVIC